VSFPAPKKKKKENQKNQKNQKKAYVFGKGS
jgi:hypothetical protein